MVRIVAAALLALALPAGALAWTGPASAPPAGNVAAPLNTGSVLQQKSGRADFLGGLYVQNPSEYYTYFTLPDSAYGLLTNGPIYVAPKASASGYWAADIRSAGSYGLYASNASGYYAQLANGGYGVNTNGYLYTTSNAYAADYYYASGYRMPRFGGIYNYLNGTWCLYANPYTAGCTCPVWAPYSYPVTANTTNPGSSYTTAYYCYY